ncbi:MAG: hypothetical protein EAZ27_13330 [Cytophagales bacterium]|nr:MAG: hypothetical protein EAZ27_13330 [Cytophagales bacterium]
MSKNIYQLRIIATDAANKIERMPYRVIQFHKDTNLMQLAQHILKAFSFKMSEPFGFYSDPDIWIKSEHKYELFEDDPKKNTLKNTFIDEIFDLQKEFLFIYDYLEEHRFLIIYEKMVPTRNSITYPDLIESLGESKHHSDTSFTDNDDNDEPRFASKKKTGGMRDEFDDIDDDDLSNLNGREGFGDNDDDESFDDDQGDEFDLDEFGSSGGYEEE